MVVLRAPQRSVLCVHEQRSTAKLPFAGRQNPIVHTPYTRTGETVYILLAGGDKSSQARDIEKAKKLAAALQDEEKKRKKQ
jgi:hypothetical protein